MKHLNPKKSKNFYKLSTIIEATHTFVVFHTIFAPDTIFFRGVGLTVKTKSTDVACGLLSIKII